jgi:hypothetical protein
MLAHPVAVDQGSHQLAIELSRVLVINVFDYATFLQLRSTQPARQRTVFPPSPLLIY